MKDLRGQTSEIDNELRQRLGVRLACKAANDTLRNTEAIIETHGTSSERDRLRELTKQRNDWSERGDIKRIEQRAHELSALWWEVVQRQGWYWRARFEHVLAPKIEFTDVALARELRDKGRQILLRGDDLQLRPIVESLSRLRPKAAVRVDERLDATGLRKR